MKPLRFRENGTFTIVQFTDLHWQNGEPEDLRTYSLMNDILEAESPDLVVFTGDVIYSNTCGDPLEAYRQAVKAAEERGIPWASVFGNHDAETNCTKADLLRVQQEHAHCLTESGPALDDRVGNYVIRIHPRTADTPPAVLYMLDSGGGSTHAIGGYEWVTPRQVGWYLEQAKRLAEEGPGAPGLSLAFLHIPFPEYDEVWDYHSCYGHKYEKVACAHVNSGLFAAFLQSGAVTGVFVGHDHINDYWGELHGIRLHYGRATGYNTYGKEGFARGARVIRLREGERAFESWLRLEDGSRVDRQPEHAPERAPR